MAAPGWGDVLASCEADVDALVREIPVRRPQQPSGSEAERAFTMGMVAAWPDLAASTTRLLTALRQARPDLPDLAATGRALHLLAGRGMATRRARPGVVDPTMRDVARRFGAMSDLLAVGADRADTYTGRDAAAAAGRVLDVVQGLAVATRGFTEHAFTRRDSPGVTRLDKLVEAAAADRRALPGRDASLGALGDMDHPHAWDASLRGAVASWSLQARAMLDPAAAAASSRGVRLVAAGMADLHAQAAVTYAAAARAGALPSDAASAAAAAHQDAHRAWREVTAAWTRQVTAGGPAPVGVTDAAAALRAAVKASVSPGEGAGVDVDALAARPDLAVLVSDTRRVSAFLPQVAIAYRDTTATLIGSSVLAVPARAVRDELRPIPPEVAQRALRGRWTALPAQTSMARRLVDTAHAAQAATGVAHHAGAAATAGMPGPSLTERLLAEQRTHARLTAAQQTPRPVQTASLRDPSAPSATPRGPHL